MKVERIERDPRGLTSEVRDKIIGAMMAGELVPGDRLILDTLADQFGVSRTPVRDALLRLVSEGIVELADKRGYVFRQLSDAEIEHNLESRIAIESYTQGIKFYIRFTQLVADGAFAECAADACPDAASA